MFAGVSDTFICALTKRKRLFIYMTKFKVNKFPTFFFCTGYKDVVKILLTRGANPNRQDSLGMSHSS